MSLPNRPPLSSQIPNQAFNTTEDPATFDRLFGTLVPNIQLQPNPSEIGAPEKWVRPGDWLTLPGLNSTQEKFVGLFAVNDTDANFIALRFYGDYIVDWGDGHTEYYDSGDTAEHNYTWNKIPSTTQTSRGYRQVIVTVTPQSSSHLEEMDLGVYNDNLGLDGYNYISVPWLDIALSMPYAGSGNSIYFGTDDNVSMNFLEKVTIVDAGEASYFSYLLGWNCTNLGEFNLLNAPYLTDLSDAFYHCVNLKNLNICDLPLLEDLSYTFQECYSLEHIELTGLNSAYNFSNMFYDCTSLKSVRMTGLTYADSELYDLIDSYVNQRTARSLTLEDLTSVSDLENITYDWGYDLRGHVKLTGLTGLTDIQYAFQYDYALESVELSGLDNVTGAYEAFEYCYSLKEVKLEGTQNIEDMSYMFSECYSLEKAPMFDTSSVEYMYDMFEYCYSLTDVPLYDTSNVSDMSDMFYECYSLRTIPKFDTSLVYYTNYMFGYCSSLETIPLLDLPTVGDMDYMFYYCYSLQKVPALSVSTCTNFDNMFEYCTALGAAPLKGATDDISFYNCALSRNAIVAIFKGLASASAEIDVSYNFGANDLTSEDIAIAEDKGWTVTY